LFKPFNHFAPFKTFKAGNRSRVQGFNVQIDTAPVPDGQTLRFVQNDIGSENGTAHVPMPISARKSA